MQLIIEIVQGHDAVTSRKTEFGEKYSMKGYMHTGGAYPVEIRIPLNDNRAFPAGKYYLHPAAFRVGKYGDMEVNNFELANCLRPLPTPQQKAGQ